jgi:hypothetical protein
MEACEKPAQVAVAWGWQWAAQWCYPEGIKVVVGGHYDGAVADGLDCTGLHASRYCDGRRSADAVKAAISAGHCS